MRAVLVLALAALAGSGALAALSAAPGPSVVEARALDLPAPAGSAGLRPAAPAYAELSAEDPSLRLVVGLARGPTLLGLLLGAAPQRVLAVPEGAPADLAGLEPTGRTFDFTDPHGNAWSVAEYEAPWGTAYGTAVGAETLDAHAGAYNFVLLVDEASTGPYRLVAA